MNDRFKFRYWHTKENKYIHTQCDCLAICNSCLHSIRDIPDVRGWYNTILDQGYNDFELIPEQCTGVKDTNDNLIYENDIVEQSPSGDKYKIIWIDTDCGWGLENAQTGYIRTMNCFDGDELEIIGNIHEQAEQKDK